MKHWLITNVYPFDILLHWTYIMFAAVAFSVNCSSQTGTSVIGEHDEYTVTNKESNQVDFFPPGVLREILGDRIQPTNGKHVKTQRRLRRSLTPEEKAKLMM